MKSFHVFFSGFVQGVGFRKLVRHHARKMGICGWVKNGADGRVEAVLQGDEEKINELIHVCQKGRMQSMIKKIEQEEIENEPRYHEFVISY